MIFPYHAEFSHTAFGHAMEMTGVRGPEEVSDYVFWVKGCAEGSFFASTEDGAIFSESCFSALVEPLCVIVGYVAACVKR
jgi:hypothetical protein